MWSVCASQQVTETLGNALKKMAFPLLYLEPPLQDQSNVPPPGEKGLGYCCQVTVSMQTGYVSRIHRMMTSCWGGRDKRLFTRFISSLFVEREVHKQRDESATWEGEKEQWREIQKRREDASARKTIPRETRLQPYQPFLTVRTAQACFMLPVTSQSLRREEKTTFHD